MQLNASRIKILQAQDEAVNSMKDAAKKALLRLSSDKKVYKKLLKDMMVQVFELDQSYSYIYIYIYIGAYHMRGVVYYESERSKSKPYNHIWMVRSKSYLKVT